MNIICQSKDREIAKVIDPSRRFCVSSRTSQFNSYPHMIKAVAAFAPLLKKRKSHIKQVLVNTFRYRPGDSDRDQVSRSLNPSSSSAHPPSLTFITLSPHNLARPPSSSSSTEVASARAINLSPQRPLVSFTPMLPPTSPIVDTWSSSQIIVSFHTLYFPARLKTYVMPCTGSSTTKNLSSPRRPFSRTWTTSSC